MSSTPHAARFPRPCFLTENAPSNIQQHHHYQKAVNSLLQFPSFYAFLYHMHAPYEYCQLLCHASSPTLCPSLPTNQIFISLLSTFLPSSHNRIHHHLPPSFQTQKAAFVQPDVLIFNHGIWGRLPGDYDLLRLTEAAQEAVRASGGRVIFKTTTTTGYVRASPSRSREIAPSVPLVPLRFSSC